MNDRSVESLLAEIAELQSRLAEAEDTIRTVRSGEVDALVVGEHVYRLDSAAVADVKLRGDALAQMDDAVMAFDVEDRLVFMNRAAERQYGRSASETLGLHRCYLYEERWRDPAEALLALREVEKHGSARTQSVHVALDGHAFHVESSISQLWDGIDQTMGRLYVIRNISERVEAEHTLLAATQTLARRERQFSTLVENSPDIVARFDRQLRHVYVSPAVERYSGRSSAEHIGKTHAELGMAPALLLCWNAAIEAVFASGAVERLNYELLTHDASRRFFACRLIPEFGDDGAVESVLSIASDVTEQALVDNALRESQEQLRFTLEAAKVGDWELDLVDGTVRHSLRYDRCFGYENGVEFWNHGVMLDHVHPLDRAGVSAEFQRSITSGDDLHFECRVLWPAGGLHWIEVRGRVYRNQGAALRMQGVVFDATERKATEAQLLEADRRKDEFLATLAHELRNPLAPIAHSLELMRRHQDPAAHEVARNIVERQIKQMVHLVDDLLDVSRITKGKLELRREPVDVRAFVQAAVETSTPLIDAGQHQLIVRLPEEELVVDGDATRLTQIVANLLNNAAKYTPAGGRVEVAVVREGACAVVTVEDTGVGIPEELLPRVFDMFTQVDRSLARAQGGLGIGLALVRSLAQAHGGMVEAFSEGHNRGCRFLLRLPLLEAAAAGLERLPPTAAPVDVQGTRVLIVDDNQDSAESLAQLLEIIGYQTRTAADGVEAVAMAAEYRPRIVLLDIGLPKLNGYEVARRIRQEPWGQSMCLIAISGWGQDEDRRKSTEAGFDRHFVKPVNPTVLMGLMAATVAAG